MTKRDTLYEQHPPVLLTNDLVEYARATFVEKLNAVGQGDRAAVAKMALEVPVLDAPVPAGEQRIFEGARICERGIYFAERYAQSLREENHKAAAFYAYQVGYCVAKLNKVLVEEMETEYAARRRREAGNELNDAMRLIVESYLLEKKWPSNSKRLATAGEAYAHARIGDWFGIELPTFRNWWGTEKIANWIQEHRKPS